MIPRLVRWLLARQVRYLDIRNVVASREFGGPDRLQQIYEWHASRIADVLKGLAGTIATVLTTIFFALLKDEIAVHVPLAAVFLFVVAIVGAGAYAAYLYWRLARIPAEYAESLRLFQAEAASANPDFPSDPWS